MANTWDYSVEKELEVILFNLGEEPLHLFEIARRIKWSINSNKDKASLRYRMNTVKKKHKELEFVGYTPRGYILPTSAEEFHELYMWWKSRGDGFQRRANRIKEVGQTKAPRSKEFGQLVWDFNEGKVI